MHAYISSIAIETSLFSSALVNQQDDLMIRNMIKAALQLGMIDFSINNYFLFN